ncbi:MAG: FtsX-like permease family protein [Bacteroidota bacterium]|jgi:ABC-type lipoprotein release transport system permease subunit
MLFTIAWRNVWRNRRRSQIVMVSIIVGVVAVMFNDGLSVGMVHQMLSNQIGSHVSHIQIHAKGFNDNRVIQNYIHKPAAVEQALDHAKGVQHWSKRVITFGLLSSAVNSSGGLIVGVDKHREPEVTSIRSSLISGSYLSGKPHEVVIGRRLADRLKVDIGDKVVGMASALNGDVGSDLFRVVGIFETVSSDFDKMYMFTSLENAQNMLELSGNVLEYAIIVDDISQVVSITSALRRELGAEYEVLSYIDLLPLLVAQVEMYNKTMYIIYLIIGLAMVFGIINTMLMSVFERIQEFGVLMAIGMKNSYVFRMVMAEALLLSLLGTGIGLLLGIVLLLSLNATGINFSMFAEGLNSFGVGAIIYPKLTINSIMSVVIIIPLTALLGSIYPALKATRLQPVNAIRYV